jgi:hypothetical protein
MSLVDLAVRVYWMILGPGALVLTGILIAGAESAGPSALDALYGVLLLALLLDKYADFAWLLGRDADGRPLTARGVYRWLGLASAASVAWLAIAHGIGWLQAG